VDLFVVVPEQIQVIRIRAVRRHDEDHVSEVDARFDIKARQLRFEVFIHLLTERLENSNERIFDVRNRQTLDLGENRCIVDEPPQSDSCRNVTLDALVGGPLAEVWDFREFVRLFELLCDRRSDQATEVVELAEVGTVRDAGAFGESRSTRFEVTFMDQFQESVDDCGPIPRASHRSSIDCGAVEQCTEVLGCRDVSGIGHAVRNYPYSVRRFRRP